MITIKITVAIKNNSTRSLKKFYPLLPLQKNNIISFEQGLDYILSHFDEPIWPRTISTHTTEGKQILVYDKEIRINAYPDYTEYRGINRQAPNLLFLDLDRSTFSSEKAFDTAFNLPSKYRKNLNLSDIK